MDKIDKMNKILVMSENRFNELSQLERFNKVNGRDYESHLFIQFMAQTKYKDGQLFDLLVALGLEYEKFSYYETKNNILARARDYFCSIGCKDELWRIGIGILREDMPFTYLATKGYIVEVLGEEYSDDESYEELNEDKEITI